MIGRRSSRWSRQKPEPTWNGLHDHVSSLGEALAVSGIATPQQRNAYLAFLDREFRALKWRRLGVDEYVRNYPPEAGDTE